MVPSVDQIDLATPPLRSDRSGGWIPQSRLSERRWGKFWRVGLIDHSESFLYRSCEGGSR